MRSLFLLNGFFSFLIFFNWVSLPVASQEKKKQNRKAKGLVQVGTKEDAAPSNGNFDRKK